ncbi:MAG: hypothetical protein ACM37W_02665 [Actinomycetota bacterium]
MASPNFFKVALATATLAVALLPISRALAEYSFTVTNKTSSAIREILVSEDGKSWGHFDVGSGIGAGETAKLVWDKSTNNESCTQYIKAVYKDGSEAAPAKFNFCEETNLVFE